MLPVCDTFTDRDAERNSKGSRGRSQVFPASRGLSRRETSASRESQVLFWNKNKTRARIVFSRPRSLKERCTRSMEKPHMVSQDRDKEDDTSVSDI